MKGLPIFVMNQILKRHPLALHYVRRQLTDSQDMSSVQDSSDDEENSELTMTGLHESKEKSFRTEFEEEVPTRHFIDDHC